MSRKSVVYAVTNATVAHRGEAVPIRAGDPWDADSPVVKAHPGLFLAEHDMVRAGDGGGIVPADEAPVERGTRAPGEKRGQVRR